MIERKFVAEKIKEFQIEEYITSTLGDVGHSHSKMQKTALGERIVIHASRPGLVVGRKGENIKRLTKDMKKNFQLENPQIEIAEVEQMWLDAKIVADRIASTLERFGSQRFKGVGHQTMQAVMDAGALGVEILISGKVPSARAKSWRFYRGYLKKCGDVAVSDVRVAYSSAKLKTGIVGIKVSIMPSDIRLPDKVIMIEEPVMEEKKEKPAKKKSAKKEEKAEEKKTEKSESKDEKTETAEKVEEKTEPAKEEKTETAEKVEEKTEPAEEEKK